MENLVCKRKIKDDEMIASNSQKMRENQKDFSFCILYVERQHVKPRTKWGLKDHHANLQCKEIYCVQDGFIHIFGQFSWLCTKISRYYQASSPGMQIIFLRRIRTHNLASFKFQHESISVRACCPPLLVAVGADQLLPETLSLDMKERISTTGGGGAVG
ncbi:hypothetical protein POM88_032141 [Heracleum sosnowskyi]|uniref:Uncharacterized protein n=1 Tax=Heracleum sosnowskyi TaxID=360622 RepID=A0AAD8MKZ3_9APIA|nr:hypothetical protein POM88_032141 [Heracleum sosnowskyi]